MNAKKNDDLKDNQIEVKKSDDDDPILNRILKSPGWSIYYQKSFYLNNPFATITMECNTLIVILSAKFDELDCLKYLSGYLFKIFQHFIVWAELITLASQQGTQKRNKYARIRWSYFWQVIYDWLSTNINRHVYLFVFK